MVEPFPWLIKRDFPRQGGIGVVRKNRNSGDTWLRILDCAETLFARQGYNGTTTRQVAKGAGISLQTLQYHCGGKKNLYKAVLERSVGTITDLVNRYVQKMLEQDLKDARVLEVSVYRIIDEMFDLLHQHPNYAPLFYRQWLVLDPELRSAEWDRLLPVLRQWSRKIERRLDEERLRGMNLFLFFLSLSWMYWGLFVQPQFLGRYLGVPPASAKFLALLKEHAWEMTLRMMEQRASAQGPFVAKPKAKPRKSNLEAGKAQEKGRTV